MIMMLLNILSMDDGICFYTITSMSCCIHFAIFRDVSNDSVLFAGVDPSSLTEYIIEFDVHIEKDSLGSRQEYIK